MTNFKHLLYILSSTINDEDAKKVIFSKLMISILGIIEKSQMDEDLTEEEIEAVWLDMVKKYIENE